MPSNLFIIEGADNTGKTTLAKFLAKHLWDRGIQATYFHFDHFGRLSDCMYDYMLSVHQNIRWCVENLGSTFVLDRSWPSEYVYGRVIGPPERVMQFNHLHHRDLLAPLSPIYIHADCDSALGRHMGSDHDHAKYSPLDFNDIKLGYGEWANAMLRSPATKMLRYDLDMSGHELQKYCDILLRS